MKILWEFSIQTNKVLINQPDIVVDKNQKSTGDIAIPSDSDVRKEYEMLEKYQGLENELEKMWKVKAKIIPVMNGVLEL